LLGYNPAGRLPAIGRANSKAPNQQHAHDGAAADTVHSSLLSFRFAL
jgi:hypothetical protein